MEVIINRKSVELTEFFKLAIGDVFESENSYYIKSEENETLNAYSIDYCDLTRFDQHEKVRIVKAKLIIDERN